MTDSHWLTVAPSAETTESSITVAVNVERLPGKRNHDATIRITPTAGG